MSNTATLVYRASQGGATQAAVAALMNAAAVPVPADILNFYGVSVSSDGTVPGNPTVRTVAISLIPTSPAAASATLEPGDPTGSPIASISLVSPGAGYVLPPVVAIGGAPTLARAHAVSYLKLVSASVAAGGSLYSANAQASVIGAIKPGGTPAKLSLTIGGGIITGVSIVNSGSGYVGVPTVVITDTTGSGGKISLSMGVGSIVLTQPGEGYFSPPGVTLVPFFKSRFPDGTNQALPFEQLMTTALSKSVLSPVSADLVVMS